MMAQEWQVPSGDWVVPLGVHGLPPTFTSHINYVFEKQKLFAISVAEQR